MRKKFALGCMLLTSVAIAGTANADIITVKQSSWNSEAGAQSALDDWINKLSTGTGTATILEDFEDEAREVVVGALSAYTPTDGQHSYTTFGGTTITANDEGNPGTGAMRFEDADNFGVVFRDVAKDNNYGRTASWNTSADGSMFGEQYLDSGDVTSVTLNHKLKDLHLSNLYFFMFDVADAGGMMFVTMSDGSTTNTSDGIVLGGSLPGQDNGLISFMGIEATDGAYIEAITWTMTSDSDGYGIDNIGTTNAVPLPASLLLLGTGLAGLFGTKVRRKR